MDVKKKVKHTVVTAVVAAGMLTNAAVDDPAGLLVQTTDDEDDPHVQVVAGVQLPEYAVYLDELEELKGMDAVRDWILRLPLLVRAVVVLPLWAIGEVGLALLHVITAGLSTTAGQFLLGFLLQLALLAAVFAILYKAIFPKTPVKELFDKKHFPWIIGSAGVLTAVNIALERVWPDWDAVRVFLMLAVGYLTLVLLWKRLCSHLPGPERKRKKLEFTCD